MLSPIGGLFDRKAVWRERMKIARDEAATKRPDAARHAARLFLETIDPPPEAIVALYFPIHTELDTKPLADALLERENGVCLPATMAKKAPLVFRRYNAGDDLIDGPYGERTPLPGADEAMPDLIVTPLLAFTRRGDRLGYGGGYYDRTLQRLRKERPLVAVGYAFAAQEVDALPVSPLDQRLDWIITEREAIRS